MTRMTLTLDEKVLNEAKLILGSKTKRETVEIALKEIIKNKKREKAKEHCGKIELDLTQDELDKYRNLL